MRTELLYFKVLFFEFLAEGVVDLLVGIEFLIDVRIILAVL